MKRSLISKGKDKFELVIEQPELNLTQVKGYSRDELREAYKSVSMQYEQLKMANIADKRKLEGIKVVDTEELREVLKNMESASKLAEKKKLEEQLKYQEEEMLSFLEQLKEIRKVVPEVVRNETKHS